MKKILTFVFVLSFVFYLSNSSMFAQNRGTGHGPSVTGGHGPDISADHGKSSDHSKGGDQTNAKNQSTGNTSLSTRISANPKLSARLTDLIPTDPATGQKITTLQALADLPWKNQGQLIAFMHVANNQHLNPTEWTNMRNAMTGTAPVSPTGTAPVAATSTDKLSVGQALHLVRPNLSQTEISAQVEQAESQTKVDLKVTTKTTS